jgi:hypothetical protein
MARFTSGGRIHLEVSLASARQPEPEANHQPERDGDD